MTANAWTVFNKTIEYIGDGTIDLDNDSFRVALVTSSYTPSVTHEAWSSVSANEVANGNGYTTHGLGITQTWVESSGTVTFDSNDPTWTASGGTITCRYAVLVKSASSTTLQSTDKLIAYALLDNAPANIVVADGADFTIRLSASGYFSVARG